MPWRRVSQTSGNSNIFKEPCVRISKLLSKTLREVPADADTISHQYLVRAGMINQLMAGVYSYLPLGWGGLKKIENIIRDEMDMAGGQGGTPPVVPPPPRWSVY